MLESLKFVQGAVSKKDYQPALTHFRIKDGRVTGYNGTIALSSPIDLDLVATPKAVPFVKAIERCKDATTAVHLTPGGKLALKSKGFRAFVDCTEESEVLDAIVPQGEEIPVAENMVQAFRHLEPFIATDASRPWAMGVMLRGYSALATNNIVVAEYWLGYGMPEINIPAVAIRELVRIGEDPRSVRLDQNSVTFYFTGDRWMRTQLLGADWPQVDALLSLEGELVPFPPGFFDAVETLKPFLDDEGRVYFREGRVTTSPEDGAGASVEIEGVPERGAYNFDHLMSLQGIASAIDFTHHPKPCPFRGPMLRGVILGMVDA